MASLILIFKILIVLLPIIANINSKKAQIPPYIHQVSNKIKKKVAKNPQNLIANRTITVAIIFTVA